MILPMLKEAVISLMSHKLRSFLTILGIIIGVGAVVLMVAAGQTVQNEINKELAGIGGNMMIVTPGAISRGGIRFAGGRSTLTTDDAQAIRQLKNVVLVAPAVNMSERVVFGSKNWNTMIIGSNLDYLVLRDWDVEEGILFNERDIDTGVRYIVIGKTVQEKLFEPGENPVGKDVRIRNIPFKIIGVLEEKGSGMGGNDLDDLIIAPLKTVRTRLSSNRFPNMVRVIILTVDQKENMDTVERRIDKLLRERHKINEGKEPDFSITNITEVANKITKIGFVLSMLLATIASISLLVGSIGIMNMMLVSVTERTREIGIRKAVGALDKDIMIQFLSESILISLIGSIVGMILGIILAKIGGVIFDKYVPISVLTVVFSILVAVVVGVVSGIFPAIKATKLDPIEALRYY